MCNIGYIKIWRSLNDWEWKQDPLMVALWVHLLSNANYEDARWQGITIKRGQLVTSMAKLSEATGISTQCLSSRFNKLKKTQEIEVYSNHHYSIITICNYERYQQFEKPTNKQQTEDINNQIIIDIKDNNSINNQQTTNEQDKKNKKSINNQQTEDINNQTIINNKEDYPINHQRTINEQSINHQQTTNEQYIKEINNNNNNNNNITLSLDKSNNRESNFKKSDVEEIGKIENGEQINYDSIVDFFNNETKGVFGKIRSPLSAVRKQHIKARIREYGKQAFADVIYNAFNSDFLKGQNSRNFRASFDWLILPTNFEKVLSGNYNTNTQSYGNTSNISNNNTNTPEWLKRCQDTMQRLAQSASAPNNTSNV